MAVIVFQTDPTQNQWYRVFAVGRIVEGVCINNTDIDLWVREDGGPQIPISRRSIAMVRCATFDISPQNTGPGGNLVYTAICGCEEEVLEGAPSKSESRQ